MKSLIKYKKPRSQYVISILSVVIMSLLCLLVRDIIEYKVVGYLLLVMVSLLAIFLEIKPVLVGAILSALVLDYLLGNIQLILSILFIICSPDFF